MAILPNLETKGSSYFGLLCGSAGLLQLRPVEAGAVTKALGRIGLSSCTTGRLPVHEASRRVERSDSCASAGELEGPQGRAGYRLDRRLHARPGVGARLRTGGRGNGRCRERGQEDALFNWI